MDPATFRRLIDAVGQAMERSPDERDAFLAAALAEDAPLLEEARALAAEADATSLDRVTARVASAVDRAAADASPMPIAAPTHIGPYAIVRELGHGGMGVVYLGRQDAPLRRDVAIKVIRPGTADAETLARFATERQVLARMDHPAIARVFDAGTTEAGLPYFVMEQAQGPPITDYCEQERLELDARLALFRTVCEAVHHGHQRGIIHRDLKPSNVLVTQVDGRAVPKVIDFGIAKALKGTHVGGSIHTRVGAIVGTLDFMSPEQIRGDGDAVDVRSDVYSLGVVLYQLVSGRHPFDDSGLHGAGLLEAQRIILETDPPRPSRHPRSDPRLAPAGRGQRVGRHRRRRQELDWIVMKALEKDPQRRYQSALALAADLDGYAHDRPVSAGPPGLSYRTRKFVRRHRLGIAAGAVVVLALAAGAVAASTGFVRATAEARRAQATSAFLSNLLASVRPDKQGRTVTVREVLDSARHRLLAGEFANDPETEATVALVIGESYEGLGQYDHARTLIQRSLDLRRARSAADDPRVFESLYALGTVEWHQGDLEHALPVRLELARLTARRAAADPLDHAESLSNLGNTYADMGQPEPAVTYLRQAVDLARRAIGDSAQLGLARFLNNLGSVYFDQQNFDSAAHAFEDSRRIRARLLGEHSDVYAITLLNLGNATLHLGNLEGAEQILRHDLSLEEQIFGGNHPNTAYVYAGLGETMLREGHPDSAEVYFQRALAVRVAHAAPEVYWRVAVERRHLAMALTAMHQLPEAAMQLRTAWQGLAAAGETTMPQARDVADDMAGLQRLLGDSTRARTWQVRATDARD
jgi:eukaryotic-like serine/threonine-protein kinase